MLNYDKTVYAKWQERYDPILRVAVENGENYLSTFLVGDFKDSDIDVVFPQDLTRNKEGMYMKYEYREPRIDEKTGLPVFPAIFISEEKRPSGRFSKVKA